jgi:hypothetical protein
MLAGLGAPTGALVVMDRGIATEENLVWLRAQGYRYLVVSRERQRQFDAEAATSIQSAGGDPIAVQRVVDALSKSLAQFGQGFWGQLFGKKLDQQGLASLRHGCTPLSVL